MYNSARNLQTRRSSPEPIRSLASERKSLAYLLLLSVWVIVLFEPHWYLARQGLTPLLKVRILLTYSLILTLVVGVPLVKSWSARWRWHAPMLAFIGIAVINLPFTPNTGLAREWMKEWILAWFILVGVLVLVDSARRVELFLLLYGLAFLWYGLWGAAHGDVPWHHVLENPDGFGAFMVIGLGFSSFMVLAFPKGRWRTMMIITAAVCVVGVVSSFARGAFLAAIAVYCMVWYRSPRKGATAAAGVGGAIVLLIAVSVLHGDKFWAEINSAFEQGASEGTGADRWELWKASVEVFKERPLLGAGPKNWGVFAAEHFRPGEVGGRYSNNPGTLYNRALHSFYFQTLSEMGLAGCMVLIWMLVDFWKRNAALRTAAAAEHWRQIGGRINIRGAALALELAMVGFLTGAFVYNVTGKHWFFTIQGLNLLLYARALGVRSKAAPHREAKVLRPAAPQQRLVGFRRVNS